MSLPTSENIYGNFAPPQAVNVALFDSSTWKLTTPFMTHKASVIELSLLKLLRSSLRNELQLPETFHAFADENRWLSKHRIRRFATDLYHGHPLTDCVARSPNLFSPEAMQAIQLGHHRAEIDRTLTRLIEQKSIELNTASRRFHFTYVTWVLTLLLLTFFLFYIWPTLLKLCQKMFEKPPKSMQLAGWVLNHSLGSIWFFVSLQLALIIGFAIWLQDIPSFRKRIHSFLGWPRLIQLRDRAAVYRLLVDSLRQGKSPSKLIETLATISNNRVVRQKLHAATLDLAQESPLESPLESSPKTSLWTALMSAGLITRRERDYLETREDGTVNSRAAQAILLESKARVSQSDIELRINRRLVLVQTVVVLLSGAVTMLISYSLFDILSLAVKDITFND